MDMDTILAINIWVQLLHNKAWKHLKGLAESEVVEE